MPRRTFLSFAGLPLIASGGGRVVGQEVPAPEGEKGDVLNTMRRMARAIRLAIAIGGDADLDVLNEFIGDADIVPFTAHDPDAFKAMKMAPAFYD